MKCFSRYLPYLFRPPSAILSSSCHAEGTRAVRGGGAGRTAPDGPDGRPWEAGGVRDGGKGGSGGSEG